MAIYLPFFHAKLELLKQLDKQLNLLNEYENELIIEKDPRWRMNCRDNSEKIKTSISEIKEEINSIGDISLDNKLKDVEQKIVNIINVCGNNNIINQNIQESVIDITQIVKSIDEQEIEQNPDDKQKAEELLQVILERLDKIEFREKREINDKLKTEVSTRAKLKLIIPFVPLLFHGEYELALKVKKPIINWKDLWRIFVKHNKDK